MREILQSIKNWLIHLFDTHCDECRHERIEDEQCINCEYLKAQLENEKFERDKLQTYILRMNDSSKNEEQEVTIPQPIIPKHMPWNIKRASLEKADREEYQRLKTQQAVVAESNKSTEQLEKELLNGD